MRKCARITSFIRFIRELWRKVHTATINQISLRTNEKKNSYYWMITIEVWQLGIKVSSTTQALIKEVSWFIWIHCAARWIFKSTIQELPQKVRWQDLFAFKSSKVQVKNTMLCTVNKKKLAQKLTLQVKESFVEKSDTKHRSKLKSTKNSAEKGKI